MSPKLVKILSYIVFLPIVFMGGIPIQVSAADTVWAVCVGGGGGGGSSNTVPSYGGAGAGGGYKEDTALSVSATTYDITIGTGGTGGAGGTNTQGGTGGTTTMKLAGVNYFACGGGGGGGYAGGAPGSSIAGSRGGSGGGGGWTAGAGGAGYSGEGFAGENGQATGGGGGGGADEAGGTDGTGYGGDGHASSITGTSTYRGGGHLGCSNTCGAVQGLGSEITFSTGNGEAGMGGGGYGPRNNNPGGNAGKGIFIVSYVTANFGSTTYTGTRVRQLTDGANTVLEFRNDGTWTVVLNATASLPSFWGAGTIMRGTIYH